MCEPISTTAALTAFGATALAGLSGYSAYSSSQAQKQQANYEAEVAEQNAEAAYQTAGATQRQAEDQKRDIAMRALQDKGNAKTQFAASGMSLKGGSYENYLNDIAAAYNTNIGRLDYDTSQKTTSYLQNAFNYSSQAQASKAQAKAVNTGLATTTGAIQGAATAISLRSGIKNVYGV